MKAAHFLGYEYTIVLNLQYMTIYWNSKFVQEYVVVHEMYCQTNQFMIDMDRGHVLPGWMFEW